MVSPKECAVSRGQCISDQLTIPSGQILLENKKYKFHLFFIGNIKFVEIFVVNIYFKVMNEIEYCFIRMISD